MRTGTSAPRVCPGRALRPRSERPGDGRRGNLRFPFRGVNSRPAEGVSWAFRCWVGRGRRRWRALVHDPLAVRKQAIAPCRRPCRASRRGGRTDEEPVRGAPQGLWLGPKPPWSFGLRPRGSWHRLRVARAWRPRTRATALSGGQGLLGPVRRAVAGRTVVGGRPSGEGYPGPGRA